MATPQTQYGFASKDQMEDYFFEGVTDEFADWFYDFNFSDRTFGKVNSAVETASYYLAIPAALLMILHLIVLTRKSMLTSSTNMFLLFIAITDFLFVTEVLGQYAYLKYQDSMIYKSIETDCSWTAPYWLVCLRWYGEVVRDYFNRTAGWVGVLLTVSRALALRCRKEERTHTLTSVFFAFTSILITLFLCLPMPIFTIFSHQITMNISCNTSDPQPIILTDSSFHFTAIFYSLEVFLFQLVPTLLIIIFMFLLACSCMRRQNSLGTEGWETTNINIVVFLYSVVFILTRGIQAFVVGFQGFAERIPAFEYLAKRLPYFVNLSITISTILHFVFCLTLMVQYRDAVRKMFNLENTIQLTSMTRRTPRSRE